MNDQPPIATAIETTVAAQRRGFYEWLLAKAAAYRDEGKDSEAEAASDLADKYLVEVGVE